MSAPKTTAEWGVKHAESTVLAHASYASIEMTISEENISALLANLMHLAEHDGLDFAQMLSDAETIVERERCEQPA